MIKYLLVNFLKNLGLFQRGTVSAYKQMPLIYLSDTPQEVDIISNELEKYVLRILHFFHQLKSEI